MSNISIKTAFAPQPCRAAEAQPMTSVNRAIIAQPTVQPTVAQATNRHALRVLFLGMTSAFSQAVLDALLAKGIDICGILLAAPRARVPDREIGILSLCPAQPSPEDSADKASLTLPVLNPFVEQNIVQRAWANAIPIYEVGQMAGPDTHALITSLAPDAACVACFSRRVPASLLAAPTHGFLNVHPSRLPHYRGPSPCFWIFRDGTQHDTGVTVHWLDEGLDTGDIAAQATLSLPDGISGPRADVECARVGGQLLYEVLCSLADGTVTRQSQPVGGSYQPQPQRDDFVLSTGWSARRAFNFMRGTAEWGQPYRVRIEEEWVSLREAISVANRMGSSGVERHTEKIEIQFADGVLYARRWSHPLTP